MVFPGCGSLAARSTRRRSRGSRAGHLPGLRRPCAFDGRGPALAHRPVPLEHWLMRGSRPPEPSETDALLERSRELASLEAALGTVRESSCGRLVLIAGEAG